LKYSQGFRASVIRRTLDGSGSSIPEVAREMGVSDQTIRNWIEKQRLGKLDMDDATGMTPDQRNPGEKLSLLLESTSLGDEQKGEWLRQHGLHSEHLALWEQELTAIMNDKQTNLNQKNAKLKKENKRLKRELERKERALSEAAVLLTLKKSSAICLRTRTRRAEQREDSPGNHRVRRCSKSTRGTGAYYMHVSRSYPSNSAELAQIWAP
jgi:transposase